MRTPYWHEHHQFGAGWMLVMLVFAVVVVAAVVALVLVLSRAAHPGAPPHAGPPQLPAPPGGNDAAVRVLAERFALGEIDEAEFRAKLAVLRGASG